MTSSLVINPGPVAMVLGVLAGREEFTVAGVRITRGDGLDSRAPLLRTRGVLERLVSVTFSDLERE